MAVGITAFCLLALYGLFPVAFKNAIDSRRETRAAFLAEQIVSDLRNSSFSNAILISKPTGEAPRPLSSMSLAVQASRYFACNSENQIVNELTESEFSGGVSNPSVESLVAVRIEPTGFTNLSRIVIEVEAPPGVLAAHRASTGFSTLIGMKK